MKIDQAKKIRIINIAGKLHKHLLNLLKSYDNLPWEENLCGACLISSYFLKKTLHSIGIDSKLSGGCYITDEGPMQHFWLIVDDYIVDATAVQFRNLVTEDIPNVVFRRIDCSDNVWYNRYYCSRNEDEIFNTVNKITHPDDIVYRLDYYDEMIKEFIKTI